MANFERKRERCEALGKAYQSVLDTRNHLSGQGCNYSKRPVDENLAIQWDTLTEVMQTIEEML